MGLNATGSVGLQTWRWLLWHYDRPSFNATSLCDYSVGNGPPTGGPGPRSARSRLRPRSSRQAATGGSRSVTSGSNTAGHPGPPDPPDRDWMSTSVSSATIATSAGTGATTSSRHTIERPPARLIKAIRATAPGHVKLIYFNDPVLIGKGSSSAIRATTTTCISATARRSTSTLPTTAEARLDQASGPRRAVSRRRLGRFPVDQLVVPPPPAWTRHDREATEDGDAVHDQRRRIRCAVIAGRTSALPPKTAVTRRSTFQASGTRSRPPPNRVRTVRVGPGRIEPDAPEVHVSATEPREQGPAAERRGVTLECRAAPGSRSARPRRSSSFPTDGTRLLATAAPASSEPNATIEPADRPCGMSRPIIAPPPGFTTAPGMAAEAPVP